MPLSSRMRRLMRCVSSTVPEIAFMQTKALFLVGEQTHTSTSYGREDRRVNPSCS